MSFKTFEVVELGGKEKVLRFDLNAVADLEEHFGLGIGEIFDSKRVGFSTIRAFYWTGLKAKDPGITLQRVGQMLQKEVENGRSFEELMKPIMSALKKSKLLGEEKEEDGEETDLEELDEPTKN